MYRATFLMAGTVYENVIIFFIMSINKNISLSSNLKYKYRCMFGSLWCYIISTTNVFCCIPSIPFRRATSLFYRYNYYSSAIRLRNGGTSVYRGVTNTDILPIQCDRNIDEVYYTNNNNGISKTNNNNCEWIQWSESLLIMTTIPLFPILFPVRELYGIFL